MTKIKICGLTKIEDINTVNKLMPDYIGFVFAKSRRQVTHEKAVNLKSILNPNIKAVGVFVNEPISKILRLVNDSIIDIIQLHGDEGEEYITKLKQATSCPIIKAVRVQSTEQILKYEALPCDMLLLDTYKNGEYGGSGESFDITLIPQLKKPFFLAGGINSDNVENKILKCNPFAVDISSGVETNGLKDEIKIQKAIEILSNINRKQA